MKRPGILRWAALLFLFFMARSLILGCKNMKCGDRSMEKRMMFHNDYRRTSDHHLETKAEMKGYY